MAGHGCDLVTVGIVCADVMVRPVDELPAPGTLALVPQVEMHMGGLAAVTAAVFCRLGGKAAFLGRVGTDSFGDFLIASLQASGVDVGLVTRDAEQRSSATAVLIREDGERTFLHHLGANAALCEDDFDAAMLGGARLFHWGGPAVTPGLDGAPMSRILAQAKAAGLQTSLDTCYDGKGIWLPLVEASLPHLDIVFTNLEEGRHYTGCEDPSDIALFFQDRGVVTVVVKLGEEGIFAQSGTESLILPSHDVPVVDTTGAGDSACAGFLYGVSKGWPLRECAGLANAVGALTVQCMGGANGVQSLDAALALTEKIQ